MNRRTFFSLLGSSCGALVAVVAVPSVAVASGCIATASNTPVFEGRIGTIDGVVIHHDRERLLWSRDIWKKFETAFEPEFADPCRNVPSAPGADGYDYLPAYWEI